MAYEFPVAYPDAPDGVVPYIGADGAMYGLTRPADWEANVDRYVIGMDATGYPAWRLLPTDVAVLSLLRGPGGDALLSSDGSPLTTS